MEYIKKQNRKYSFKKFVIGIIIILMTIFEVCMVWGSAYISKTVKNERKNSYASALEIYSSNLDQKLKQIDRFLLQSVMIEGEARSILESSAEIDRYLAEVRMKSNFEEALGDNELLSGVLWYGKSANRKVKVFQTQTGADTSDAQWLMENVDILSSRTEKGEYVDWFLQKTEKQTILMRILENRETCMIGWISAEQVFDDFENTLSGEKNEQIYLQAGEHLMFQSDEGEQKNFKITGKLFRKNKETIKMTGDDYQLIFPHNDYTVSLCLAIKQEGFYWYLTDPYIVVPVVVISSGFLIFFLSVILSWYFIRPMDELREAMLKMQDGDLSVRLDENAIFEEFSLLNINFDHMAEKIKDLKIEVYEEQLEKQNAELQYLEHQINPHFLTNCLNTVKNLLFLEEYEKAEQFTSLLGKNIRYDLSKKTEITLEEELAHVKNYIALSQIRYEDQIRLILNVEEEILSAKMPVMLVQTFVENAVKHEIVPGELLYIRIDIWKKRSSGNVVIYIEDSGQGFPENILKKLKNGESIVKNGVEHVGISNVKRRLELMYGNRAVLDLFNGQKGAAIQIEIPWEVVW